VSSFVIESVSAFLTVALTVVNDSVFWSTRVWVTESQSLSAISLATFFSMRLSAKLWRMGLTSSSVRTLFPATFWNALVSLLNRPVF